MAVHPASIKNPFLGHFVMWSLFLPLLTTIFTPMVAPDQNITEAEITMVQGFNVDIHDLTERSNATFSKNFVENGAMEYTEHFFSGKGPVPGAAKEASFGRKWIRGVWLMVYKAIWRMHALLMIFFIPALIMCIPAFIDGLTVRLRKKYRFENYNPVMFYSSTHMVTFVVGMFVFLPLAPISLSVNMLSVMLAGVTIAVWVATSNLQAGS